MKMVRWELQGKIREGVEDLSKQLATRLERLESMSGVQQPLGEGMGDDGGLGLDLAFGGDDSDRSGRGLASSLQRGGMGGGGLRGVWDDNNRGADDDDADLEEDLFRTLRRDDPVRANKLGGGLLSWFQNSLGARQDDQNYRPDSGAVAQLKLRRRQSKEYAGAMGGGGGRGGGGGGGGDGGGGTPTLFVSHEAPSPPWELGRR